MNFFNNNADTQIQLLTQGGFRCISRLNTCHRILGWFAAAMLVVTSGVALGQDAQRKAPPFELNDQVRDVLVPLFSSIAKADVSRAKVELAVETVLNGEIVNTELSSFQIASRYPDSYTVYHKSADERLRIFADGKQSVVAISPQAYYELPEVLDCQSIVNSSPVALGPYPEPMLALTLAGVDPAMTFLSGMTSLEVVGDVKFRGRTDAIQLRGRQDDGVVWDFWVTDDQYRRPLRLLINLTPMLVATQKVRVPRGYELSLRYDFVSWRVTGEVDDKLFSFRPAKDAKKFASMQAYTKQAEAELAQHPLLGKQAPEYSLQRLDGSKITSKDLKGKIVVLDFWATWCTPCLEAMPVIAKTVQAYADKDVVLLAVNVGENAKLVEGFSKEQDWGVDVTVDPEGRLIDMFTAKKIPLTMVIAPNGIVEAVHVGYPGPKALAKNFKDELDVLVQGGRIASSKTK
ncbi:Thiol-disulfide isomerase or thioredoxin [Neorhodopirellula lusitana]|uniref:Thiol-disulfide isomerase or thioredoxin n=1 Tax=Neorhodopirellula lusitana TaxID=445327 RepID=A0ABY1Q6C3_9BACT|nr:Thiol-disulfide isomerase or thioredoxin [Neorhodopirellula lusitana]